MGFYEDLKKRIAEKGNTQAQLSDHAKELFDRKADERRRKQREAKKKERELHPEKIKAIAKRYRERHHELCLKLSRDYYDANKERLNEYSRKYNKEHYAEMYAKRRKKIEANPELYAKRQHENYVKYRDKRRAAQKEYIERMKIEEPGKYRAMMERKKERQKQKKLEKEAA